MISFKKFVQAVHDAILGANNTLMDQNLGLLEQYFEDPESSSQGSSSGSGTGKGTNVGAGVLKAKSVAIQYPHQTEKGVELVDVQVPLITLVPVTTTQIDKVKLKAEFQLTMINDELQLLFPKEEAPRSKSFLGLGPRTRGTFGEIEITISPAASPTGLRELIEGYEDALKAQIPH